ncbi:hypothetical protein AOQ84DRAFT_23355 [Glonium stellatum]|uniref:Uncharacterized protein n=1 Tax=Glonium stellatum TaxID=574774 RepID=A0A8E2F2G6_9PEZI|nr:hypothetical protein AOQ84DRAFT_23355 [Glonium stellatum]
MAFSHALSSCILTCSDPPLSAPFPPVYVYSVHATIYLNCSWEKRVLVDVTNTDAPSARRQGCGNLNEQIDNCLSQRSIKHQNQSLL